MTITPTSSRGRAAALTIASALAAAPLVWATPASAADAPPPGNNGNLKVHNAATGMDENRNEPKILCEFYLAGYGFDLGQVVKYSFTVQGNGPNNGDLKNGDPDGTPGQFTADIPAKNGKADGRTGNLNALTIGLNDGVMYKVTTDTGKSKVFTVDCPGGVVVPPEEPPGNPPPGGGGGGGGGEVDDGEVAGVRKDKDKDKKKKKDRDDGPKAVGGVNTGGGGDAGGPSSALPLVAGTAAIALAGGLAFRLRRN